MIGFWRTLYSPVKLKSSENEYSFFQQVLLSNRTYKKNYYYTKHFEKDDVAKRFPKYSKCSSNSFDDNAIYYEKIETTKTPFSSSVTQYPN
jgi:hypothetical protein